MKKLITLILALIMILTMFVACTIDTSELPVESSSEQPAGSSAPEETESGPHASLGIPEDLNYGNSVVSIMHWGEARDEFDVTAEESTGDPVLEAIYKRNLYTEELLGVDLNFILSMYVGSSKDQLNTWCDTLQNAMNDPETPIDIFASFSRVLSKATIRGLNQDVSVYENLDLDKEWWPSDIFDELSVDGKLFSLTGELSTNVIYNMYSVFYNKTLAEQKGLPDLESLVESKEWTVDKLIEVTAGAYEDIDGENGKSEGDRFGLAMDWWCADALVMGAEFKLLEGKKVGDQYVRVTEDFYSKDFGSFIEKLGTWAATDNVFDESDYRGAANAAFCEGRSVFTVNVLANGFTLQETDTDYGVLPTPLRDKTQKMYRTALGNSYSNYGMTKNCPDGERAAAVLAALGYYGSKLTTPAVYEIIFNDKLSKDPDMGGMLDTIEKGVCFDMAWLYMRELNSISDTPALAILQNKEWSVAMNSVQRQALARSIIIFNSNLQAILDP